MAIPKRGVAYARDIVLIDTHTGALKANPTITAGDFKVSTDESAFVNLATLPTVSPAGSVQIKLSLSVAEMTGDRVTVYAHDPDGEWADLVITIEPTVATVEDIYALVTGGGGGDLAAIKAQTDQLVFTEPGKVDASAELVLAEEQIQDMADQIAGAIPDPLTHLVPGSYVTGSAGAALGRIGVGTITTVSPVAQDGDVETIRGDDYLAADGRALVWTDASAAWPDLAGAAIVVGVRGLSFDGAVVQAIAPGRVRLELTAAETAMIAVGHASFQVQATLANGHVVTLVQGVWTSRKDLAE